MTEAGFIVDPSGEVAPNLDPGRLLHVAEAAKQDLPIAHIEIAKREIHRARSVQRMADMLAEGRILERITESTRLERIQEQRSSRLGNKDLGLVISAGRGRRFAPSTPQPPRTPKGGRS